MTAGDFGVPALPVAYNLGDFMVRTVHAMHSQQGLTVRLWCTQCDRLVEPHDTYEGGTTLAVLCLDARRHVQIHHPGARWAP